MSMDDMQWQQQQDEQRMARERAQQLETERMEREQLDEDDRIEREERAQRRLEAHAHSGAEIERHEETGRGPSFLSGMFGLFRRRAQDQAQSPSEPTLEAAPFVPPMQMPGVIEEPVAATRPQFREAALVEASAPKRASNLVLLGVSAAVIGGALWAYTALKSPERMPTGLEGTTEEFRDSPPPSTASATPSSTVVLPDPAAQAIAAQQRPTVETAAAAILGTTAPSTPTLPQEPAKAADHDQASTAPAIAAPAAPTAADADAMQQRIAQLETEMEQLRQLLSERPSASAVAPAVSAGAAPVADSKSRTVRKPVRVVRQAAAPAPVEVAPPPPSYNGRLLSVDMWNGKPSVVVSTGDPSDTRLRVMQPGESINGITLREASVQARSATFDVGSGRLVKLGVED